MKLTKEQRQIVYDKYDGHCAYCGNPLSFKDMQVDHIHPKYKGGEDVMSNFNPSCRRCNHYKDTFSLEKLRLHLSEIPRRLMRDVPTFNLALAYGLITINKNRKVEFYFEKVERERKR